MLLYICKGICIIETRTLTIVETNNSACCFYIFLLNLLNDAVNNRYKATSAFQFNRNV